MNQTTATPPKNNSFDPFAGPAISRVIYTTQAQLEIWTSCQIGGAHANKAYNESLSLRLNGPMNLAAMQRALAAIVQRHESLRAVFSPDGRFMSVFETLAITIDRQDFSRQSNDEKQDAVAEYLRQHADHLFDLVNGPLLKIGLLRLFETEHRLVITAHHLICDGWSLGILLQELGTLYSAYIEGVTPELPVPESYMYYADKQQELVESGEYATIEQFWLRQFEPRYAGLILPTDFRRPSKRTYESQRLDFPLDKMVLANIKKTGLAAGCRLVTTLLTAFEVFLYRITGQDDIVIGLPTAGQSVTGMHQLIGHCVNLLPLRSKLRTDMPFVDYLKQRKSNLLDAYDHQQLSFGQLLQKLFVDRDAARVPLVPVIFNIDLGLADGVSFTDLSYRLISDPRHYETFELFLNASGTEDDLVLEWSYNTALFKPDTIRQMMASFVEVLQRLNENSQRTIGDLIRIDSNAYAALNATQTDYPRIPLHELLAERALAFPERKALKFGDLAMNYKDMHQQVNRLAHVLNDQSVQKGDFVAVAIPRSEKLPVVLLAILQCGAAYLPLDPNYPKQRLELMLSDSGAKFLITTRTLTSPLDKARTSSLENARASSLENARTSSIENALTSSLDKALTSSLDKTQTSSFNKTLTSSLRPNCKTLFLEDMFAVLNRYPPKPLSIDVLPEDTAYLLYTSGSTGRPKGVSVSHKNIVNLLSSMATEPGIVETDVLLAITTISFDISGLELFLPLLKGAKLIIADSATARDGRLLLDMLKSENISILQATPTTWQMLVDSGWEAPLPIKAFCGGEALTLKLARQILERSKALWNMYGPTETTVYSVIKQIRADDKTICIGRPIANTRLYIMNENDQLMAPGTTGEICIGGDGVSKGYWNQPNLTAEKFIPDSFANEKDRVLYRTGDLGVLLPSGEVQCLGRTDQQVKIRGHRIEPGEIEQALATLYDVRTSAVVAYGEKLVAYVVPNAPVEAAEKQIPVWREILTERLPQYLIPHEFRILHELPVTPNGKINRQALFDARLPNQPQGTTRSPRTDTEKLVAATWKKHLNLPQIDIFDNFFKLGGYSLIALRIMLDLEKETGKRLPLSALFDHSTIEKLSLLLDGDNNLIGSESLVPIRPNGTKTPLFLIHGVGLTSLKFKDLVDNLDDDQPVYGLQGKGNLEGLDDASISVEEIAAHYIAHIRTVDPIGPYSLAGHSYGGVIAYEIARQLTDQGQSIKRLIMLDSYVEPFFYYSDPLRKEMAVAQYHIGRIFSRLKEVGKSWESITLYFNSKKEALIKRLSPPEDKQDAQDRIDEAYNERVDIMNHKIVKPYQMIPQKVKIDLIRAEHNSYYMHDPKYSGWKKLTLSGIQVYNVPGNHYDMFSSNNGEVTAKILQGILDREA
ncbi:MAG: amino acid adenylation domain-containing protein [Pricia sp.]